MKKHYQTLSAVASCLTVLGLSGSSAHGLAQTPKPSIQLTTQPPIDQVVPFKQAVKLSLAITDSQGKRVKNAKVHLQIQTPPTTPWFTTDFPIVEGTPLLNLEAVAPEGQLDLQQVFPIRGTYQLSVTATPLTPKAFTPVQQTLALTVPETPEKYRNLLILAVLLFGVGWFGGQVIGRQHPLRAGEIAPQPVRLLLSGAIGVAIVSLLVINASAERSESHDHEHSEAHHHHSAAKDSAAQVWMGTQLKLTGDEMTTVGDLARLSVQAVHQKSGQPSGNLLYQIKTIQLEDNETTFAFQTLGPRLGQLTWQQQFFDGAPHRIEVTAMPQQRSLSPFNPVTLSRTIDVQGVAPPLTTRLISLAYFTGIIALGLGLGLWQQHRTLSKQLHQTTTGSRLALRSE